MDIFALGRRNASNKYGEHLSHRLILSISSAYNTPLDSLLVHIRLHSVLCFAVTQQRALLQLLSAVTSAPRMGPVTQCALNVAAE